jgi:DNA-binding NtrC family response regulator
LQKNQIYLPRVDEQASAEPAEMLPLESCGGTETILVVEDDETVRRFVQRVLTERGYVVLAAGAPEEAEALCKLHGAGIRLMITDVILPRMNGRQLSQRATALCPGIKVVFMSGYTDDAIAHHGILEPGIAFIEKPLSPQTVLRKVREVLDSKP